MSMFFFAAGISIARITMCMEGIAVTRVAMGMLLLTARTVGTMCMFGKATLSIYNISRRNTATVITVPTTANINVIPGSATVNLTRLRIVRSAE